MSPTNASPQIKEIAQPALGRRDGESIRARRILSRFCQVLLPMLLAAALLVIPAADSAQAAKRDGTGSEVRIAALKVAQKAAATKAKRAKKVKRAKRAQLAKKAMQTKRGKVKRLAQRANASQLQAAQAAPVVDPGTTVPVSEAPATTEAFTVPPPAGTDPEPVAETIDAPAPPIEESLPGEPSAMDFAPDGPEADGPITEEQPAEPVTENTGSPSGENHDGAPAITEPARAPEAQPEIEAEAPVDEAANLPEETAPETSAEIAAPGAEAPVAVLPVPVAEAPAPETSEPVESETPELVEGETAEPVETTPDPALSDVPEAIATTDPVTEEAIPIEESAPVAEASVETTAPVEPAAVSDLVVEAISNDDKVTPGQRNTYRFRITNPAATEVRAQISATNSLPGWTSELRDGGGGAKLPSLLILAGGEAIEVVVVVAVPDDAVDGATNQTRFSVSSEVTAAPSA